MTRKTPLFDHHVDRGAKTTTFGGWEMPVQFDSINTEHESVRTSAGKFDVSHMGEIEVTGPDAVALTDRLVTNSVTELGTGRAGYGAITDSSGTMLDDTITYRLVDDSVLFIPNASHDEQMAERWRTHRDEWGFDADVENATTTWAMIAVQGPDAEDTVTAAVSAAGDGDATGGESEPAIRDLSRFAVTEATVAGADCLLARTGYTGEDGFEVLCPWAAAERVWDAFDCQPCGLGARDTLRIEAGFLLSGQDFDSDETPRNPYEAGIDFAVSLDSAFVGRDALEDVHERGPAERLTGFELVERGVPRHGYPITDSGGTEIGVVTSGTMSPSLNTPIGMGYLPTEYADGEGAEAGEGDGEISVVIRGDPKAARVKTPPFIDT